MSKHVFYETVDGQIMNSLSKFWIKKAMFDEQICKQEVFGLEFMGSKFSGKKHSLKTNDTEPSTFNGRSCHLPGGVPAYQSNGIRPSVSFAIQNWSRNPKFFL